MNREPHIRDISHLTTLAGYVHWMLTGQKVLGIGEASGARGRQKGKRKQARKARRKNRRR